MKLTSKVEHGGKISSMECWEVWAASDRDWQWIFHMKTFTEKTYNWKDWKIKIKLNTTDQNNQSTKHSYEQSEKVQIAYERQSN